MGSQEWSLMLESGGVRREHPLPPQAKTHLCMADWERQKGEASVGEPSTSTSRYYP